MQLKYTILIIFFGFFNYKFYSQTQDSKLAKLIDSLNRELKTAQYDSTKVRLKFELGHNSWLMRLGFWDSLAMDAKFHSVPLFEARCLHKSAYILSNRNEIDKAVRTFKMSLKIAEENNFEYDKLNPLSSLSNVYLNNGNLNQALNYSYKGLIIAEKLKNKKKIAQFQGLFGNIYYNIGDYNKAIKFHSKALKNYRELELNGGISDMCMALGTDYRKKNNYERAIYYYMASAENVNEFPPFMAFGIYNCVGAAYEMQQKFDSAAKYYSLTYQISKTIHFERGMVSSLALMASNSYERGDNPTAKKIAIEGLELANSIGFKTQIPDLALLLRKIYTKDKNFEKALIYSDLHISSKDSMSNEKKRQEALQKEFDYNLEKKENENIQLSQKNLIQSLQLKQNQSLLIGSIGFMVLIILIAYLFIRQSQLKADQKSAVLEQKLLRTQMNPHFIFNSLQAIQNFILNNNTKEAAIFLSSFANVTRNVLENSRMESIPLNKEIALLQNYLELQKLRFGNRFDSIFAIGARFRDTT